MHYRLLETTRIYAFEKLNDSGHIDAVLRKHAHYFCDLLEHAETDLAEETEQSWMAAYSHRSGRRSSGNRLVAQG